MSCSSLTYGSKIYFPNLLSFVQGLFYILFFLHGDLFSTGDTALFYSTGVNKLQLSRNRVRECRLCAFFSSPIVMDVWSLISEKYRLTGKSIPKLQLPKIGVAEKRKGVGEENWGIKGFITCFLVIIIKLLQVPSSPIKTIGMLWQIWYRSQIFLLSPLPETIWYIVLCFQINWACDLFWLIKYGGGGICISPRWKC